MKNQLAKHHRPNATNLSPSRTPGGDPVIAPSIPAINPPAIRRSDSGGEVVDPPAIAPPAQTSRRGFLMNTMVSAASLATAAAVATPSIAIAGDVSFPRLAQRFVVIRERMATYEARRRAQTGEIDRRLLEATGMSLDQWRRSDVRDPRWKEVNAVRSKIISETGFDDDVESSEIYDELWRLAEAMLGETPRSIADLGWQAQALLIADSNLRERLNEDLSDTDFDRQMLLQLFQNIRELGGPLSIASALMNKSYRANSLADARSSVPSRGAVQVDDPIFAAIEAHRKACITNTQRVDFEFALDYNDPARRSACVSTSKARDAKNDLALELLEITPTSLAGARALLDYVGDVEDDILTVDEDWRFPDADENGTPFHLAMIKHVADALGSTAAGNLAASDDEPAADPDAALIELGAEYERLLISESPFKEELDQLSNASDRLRYQKLGIDPDDVEACRAAARERWTEWMNAGDVASKESGYSKSWDKMNRASKKTTRIGRKILKIKPGTVAGLLIRVRVIETHDEICKTEPLEALLAEIRDFAKGASRRIARRPVA
jgi:hypothetical protein